MEGGKEGEGEMTRLPPFQGCVACIDCYQYVW